MLVLFNMTVLESTANKYKEDQTMATKKTFKVGRDAKTGQFIPVKEAVKRPSTTVVETIKKGK